MRTMSWVIGIMLWMLLGTTLGATAQTPCAPRYCIYLPNVTRVVPGPIQVLSFKMTAHRDIPFQFLSGELYNTSQQDIYQVTLLATYRPHGPFSITNMITQTIDVIFAGETLVFEIPVIGELVTDFYDVGVISWESSSNQAYRRATVTIQRVENDRTGIIHVYGTVQNQNKRALRGLKIDVNEFYGGISVYDSDTLLPHATMPFTIRIEGNILSPPSVRAYGYLAS